VEPDEARRTYDVIADEYALTFLDELARKPFDRALLERFEAGCPEGVVADIGCGPGHVGRFLADRGREMVGVDLSTAMVETARRLNPAMTFEIADMRSLPFEDGSLAGLVAFYSLIHIERADVPGVLKEFHRAVVAGGRLLLAVHGGTGLIEQDEILGRPLRYVATLFEREELAGLMESAGFTGVEAVQRDKYDFETHSPRVYALAAK
jgi:SAM-dependent methyltransferase